MEGHTDNVPVHNSRFKSNWDLSTARATTVVSLLIERHDFDPSLVSAAGYSEYRPVESNTRHKDGQPIAGSIWWSSGRCRKKTSWPGPKTVPAGQ